ncbi:MAG: hypothetical protein ACRC9L_10410 [Brevinema sp.]
METWQIIISVCAGTITILTLFDKIGLTKTFKKVDKNLKDLDDLPNQLISLIKDLESLTGLQKIQNQALLAILRNDLYRCFKDHRDLGVWTDDDCRVQTKLHEAYHALGGNGEETIWWEKKKRWKIVSEEELKQLIKK